MAIAKTNDELTLEASWNGDPSVGIFPYGYSFCFGYYNPLDDCQELQYKQQRRQEIKTAFLTFLESFEDEKPSSIMFSDEIDAENRLFERDT